MGDQYSHLLNQAHRQQLRRAGIAFCDDDFQHEGGSALHESLHQELEHILARAVCASSIDDPSQGPGED